MDLSGFRASGERAASYEEARRAVEQAALDEAASRDRALLQELLERFAAAYAEAKARESALDFEDLQLHARNLLRDNADDPRARGAALPLDHGRRVPGHEPAAVRPRRSPARARDRGLLRRRRVPVDLRLPPRGRRRLPRAARAGGAAAAADAQLPLAPRGARGGQRALRLALRRRVPAARGGGRVSRSGVRPSGRAARHRQGELRRHRRALAPRRGAGGRAARARARRHRRRDAGRDRAALRGRHRRRVVRGRAAQGRAADVPRDRARATSGSSRSSTCSRTCGCCTTATTTRRCSPCSRRRSSASRTTRSR